MDAWDINKMFNLKMTCKVESPRVGDMSWRVRASDYIEYIHNIARSVRSSPVAAL